ncbi:MAG: hypothetical protein OXH49_16525 [Gemmatimonadetes bacterium]|nr:hypothetical protein [Gemmatimonadota bacterium]
MLEIPTKGFKRSTNKSNVKPGYLADWLEANILFVASDVAKSDVVDLLIEYQICPDDQQDLAHQIAVDGWDELDRRQRWGGLPSSVSIGSARIEAHDSWQSTPLWSFFVLLSTLRIFPDWAKTHQAYAVQGDLFERVVETICPAMLPGWTSYRTGWSPDNTKDIRAIVRELCTRLFVGGGNLDRWLSPDDKDGGLDIVCYREFADEREALPTFFLQCASGKNWRDKVQTPNLDLWQKYLDPAVQPSTGIVAPFVIDEWELRRAAVVGQVVVFDRLRMLSSAEEAGITLPEDLLAELLAWMQPRVTDLPRAA